MRDSSSVIGRINTEER